MSCLLAFSEEQILKLPVAQWYSVSHFCLGRNLEPKADMVPFFARVTRTGFALVFKLSKRGSVGGGRGSPLPGWSEGLATNGSCLYGNFELPR